MKQQITNGLQENTLLLGSITQVQKIIVYALILTFQV